MPIDTGDPQQWQPGWFFGNQNDPMLPSPMREGMDPAYLQIDAKANAGEPDPVAFRGFFFPGELTAGYAFPTVGGGNPDRPFYGGGGAPIGHSDLRRDINAEVIQGGASPAGQWTVPAALNTLGHYSVLFKRGPRSAPVSHPYFREYQRCGTFAVVPDRTAAGYMARPPATTDVAAGNQRCDVAWAWWMGQGCPRVSINFGAQLSQNLDEAASLVAMWEQFYKNAPTRDTARPYTPVTLLLVNIDPVHEAQFRSMVNDPRFHGKGVTWELGNERSADLRNGPGGGNLGVGPPGFDLVDMVVQMAHAAKEEDPLCRVGTPTCTGIGEMARAGLTAFYNDSRIKAAIAGGFIDSMGVHTYNSHGGSMPFARQSIGVLLDVRNTTGTHLPLVGAEAGNFGSTRSGVGTPKSQAWQVILDVFMWELLGYLDSQQGGQGCSKETRSEFHLLSGFFDHPGWWRSPGPWLAPVHVLIHGQELHGTLPIPAGMVTIDAENRDNVWALEHRRADGTGVLAILADNRDQTMDFRIPGGENADVQVVDKNGNVRTVHLDSTGKGTLLDNRISGRGATYVRLTAAMHNIVQVPRSTPGVRVPGAQLQIFTNGGTKGSGVLADVKADGVYRDSLLYDVPAEFATSAGQWRSAKTLAEMDANGLWVQLRFQRPKRVYEMRFHQAPAHEVRGVAIKARFEVLVGGVWTQFGAPVDESAARTPGFMPNQLYFGQTEHHDDDTHEYRAYEPAGIIGTDVRFRLTEATFGFMNYFTEWDGMGLGIPLLDTDDAPGAWPPRHLNKAKIVTPTPADQASNFWGWGLFEETANPKQNAYPPFFDLSMTGQNGPALWAQDFAVIAGPDDTDGGPGPVTPDTWPVFPANGRYSLGVPDTDGSP
jgi:hypothetical protein